MLSPLLELCMETIAFFRRRYVGWLSIPGWLSHPWPEVANYTLVHTCILVLLHAGAAGIVDSRPGGLAYFLLIFVACPIGFFISTCFTYKVLHGAILKILFLFSINSHNLRNNYRTEFEISSKLTSNAGYILLVKKSNHKSY